MDVEIPEKLLALCETCGSTFVKASASQRFCSTVCRAAVNDPKAVEIIKAGSKAVKQRHERPKLER